MARTVALNAVKGGINRLRVKGSPSPNDLYDGLNCFIDASGCPTSRPGTVIDYTLPAGTRGLAAVNGGLVVFSHQVVSPMPSGVTLEVLNHPTSPGTALREIHFAGPYLGDATGAILYVAAEFEDDAVFHYWLRHGTTWEASRTYLLGDIVTPTTPNGLAYRATRLNPADPVWTANAERTLGDVIEPTEFDGFKYTVTDTVGASPRSGATEPEWNAETGAITIEDVDLTQTAPAETGQEDVTTTPPADVEDRYDNPGGSIPR